VFCWGVLVCRSVWHGFVAYDGIGGASEQGKGMRVSDGHEEAMDGYLVGVVGGYCLDEGLFVWVLEAIDD
jgi:hypothetical protein